MRVRECWYLLRLCCSGVDILRTSFHLFGVSCTPDVTDALADVRMTQRGDAVDATSQCSDRSDEEYVSSGSESEDDVLEVPSLGVRVPGQDFVDARTRDRKERHEESPL